ncbi:hypothetical protein JMJ55_13285 [Belnapia sp. T6]|uniref:Uncharacterized protein n=1 Tax=Belnapia mucosa TaxID=2804532 RepID=A0ABS1V3N5_9PROT|nr:hypothetical protein [Belnapia mucosa]MBL6456302.1 hypothetical protein [Belnapia mucosa]
MEKFIISISRAKRFLGSLATYKIIVYQQFRDSAGKIQAIDVGFGNIGSGGTEIVTVYPNRTVVTEAFYLEVVHSVNSDDHLDRMSKLRGLAPLKLGEQTTKATIAVPIDSTGLLQYHIDNGGFLGFGITITRV